jgi:hypothetical protein
MTTVSMTGAGMTGATTVSALLEAEYGLCP